MICLLASQLFGQAASAAAPQPSTLSARQQELIARQVSADPAKNILPVTLDELHPTQPAVGFDQIYYKLGRYQAEEKIIGKVKDPEKYDDFCKVNGRGSVVEGSSSVAGATLSKLPPAFDCNDNAVDPSEDMNTVVIGPGGTLYLTDGHHKFNIFWEADRGANQQLQVPVILSANYAHLSEDAFWARMKEEKKVWLKDPNGNPITPAQLPKQLGLQNFADDRYRSLVYFTREVAYDSKGANAEFLEFYWAEWLRNKVTLPPPQLTTVKSYATAVETASRAMAALPLDAVVSGDKTARALGATGTLNEKKLKKLSAADGKITYSINYKKQLASVQNGSGRLAAKPAPPP